MNQPSHAAAHHESPAPSAAPHHEDGPLLPWPELDDLVAHDYTHTQVNRFAAYAARSCRWVEGMDMTDRAQAARAAILEHLYTAERRPEIAELIRTGWQAMKDEWRRDRQVHGLNSKTAGEPAAAHQAYWTTVAAPSASPEDLVVDRLAFQQIWRTLTPLARQALAAVAEHGTIAKAAAELGIEAQLLTSRLTRARRLFRKLWHEGETMPARWGCDRDGTRHQNAMYLLRERTRNRRARQADPDRPPPRTGGPPRKSLGISLAELLHRFEAGTTLHQLSTQLGVGVYVISDRLDQARRDRDANGAAYPTPPARRPGTRRVPLPVTDAELARRHHHEQTSLNTLAAEYATSPQTIRRRINTARSPQNANARI
ncbi:hypothetical protein RIF23_10530 [Lipingzhangella sp. LS1_29]|uniref:Uncharacterized protein n=1 Tax=Lipingzhangella rawalii TaxID=2055835 RepID=A0ABU2H7B6_9ACTN|nr:hypothetical protein [Lipingzhangella rawalii]MDS1270735.1 hypothetical protein [Lipingzhangella rawalii]